MFDLPTCLTKLLALGMPLEAAIEAATSRPAALIGAADEFGKLIPGARADIALLALEDGPFPVYDVLEQRRDTAGRLRAVRTFVAGRELVPGAVPLPAPWVPLSPQQAELRAACARGERPDLASSLADPATRARPPLMAPHTGGARGMG